MCRSEFAAVLEASSLDGQELRLGDLGDHPGEFLLNELVGGDGPVVELLAQDGIGARGFVAIHGGADDAPADAEADVRGGVARRAALHQEADDALLGARPDYGHIGHAAVGDPGLLAVEHPGVAIAARGSAHAGGIGPEIRLGQAEATDRPAALQGGQPPLLLWLAAVGMDGVHDERALHGNEAAHAGIDALQFLHDEAVLGIAHAGAAVAFEIGAEKA